MYQAGDVVFCRFPIEEDPVRFTKRPALVLRTLPNNHFRIAKITSTDRRGQCVGLWITQLSHAGRKMKLRTDSFLNLSRIEDVPDFAIIRLMGICPIMKEVDKQCKRGNISY
jgi:hypothetical protein